MLTQLIIQMLTKSILLLIGISLQSQNLGDECIIKKLISYVKRNSLMKVNKHTDPNDGTIRNLSLQGNHNLTLLLNAIKINFALLEGGLQKEISSCYKKNKAIK